MKKKFSDLDSLRRERSRLEMLCKEKEARIADGLQYIQDNIGILVLTSLLPVSKSRKEAVGGFLGKVSHLLGRILPGDENVIAGRLGPVLKIVQMILAGVMYRYIRKFFNR